MEHPKVSVIIPVYHVEQYIERCARSLFSQTLDGIEFLFVDDCSPDHSIEKLQRIIEEYPYISTNKTVNTLPDSELEEILTHGTYIKNVGADIKKFDNLWARIK